jgi:hypothetical protein
MAAGDCPPALQLVSGRATFWRPASKSPARSCPHKASHPAPRRPAAPIPNAGRLIHDDMAHGALRLQIPGVIEARLGSRHVAVPSQALVHDILVHFAFDRQAERGPAEHRAVAEYRIPALDFDLLGVGVPGRPSARFDDMCPDPLTRRVDEQLIVGEQVGLLRLEAGRPMDVGTVARWLSLTWLGILVSDQRRGRLCAASRGRPGGRGMCPVLTTVMWFMRVSE